MSRESLGYFELLVLLAVVRLEECAYGARIAKAIEDATSRDVLVGSAYASLDRLQDKGLVTSKIGEATPERGGRAKRYFRITPRGLRAVRASRAALTTLWSGIPTLVGGIA